MKNYLLDYIAKQKHTFDLIPPAKVEALINIFMKAWNENAQIFVFGNGGSASNSSHFVTDLGKSASDKLGKRFRCMSLNDNVSWITAIGNDYAYEDIYQRQLYNYAASGDIAMCLSVSGNSPNVVKALEWAKANGLFTIALTGKNECKANRIADFSITVEANHYGRAEDAQMAICHMICYAIIEGKVSS